MRGKPEIEKYPNGITITTTGDDEWAEEVFNGMDEKYLPLVAASIGQDDFDAANDDPSDLFSGMREEAYEPRDMETRWFVVSQGDKDIFVTADYQFAEKVKEELIDAEFKGIGETYLEEDTKVKALIDADVGDMEFSARGRDFFVVNKNGIAIRDLDKDETGRADVDPLKHHGISHDQARAFAKIQATLRKFKLID